MGKKRELNSWFLVGCNYLLQVVFLCVLFLSKQDPLSNVSPNEKGSVVLSFQRTFAHCKPLANPMDSLLTKRVWKGSRGQGFTRPLELLRWEVVYLSASWTCVTPIVKSTRLKSTQNGSKEGSELFKTFCASIPISRETTEIWTSTFATEAEAQHIKKSLVIRKIIRKIRRNFNPAFN